MFASLPDPACHGGLKPKRPNGSRWENVNEFPNIQVYQAHNSIMGVLRVPVARELEYYLRARVMIEEIFGQSGLRPAAWECYRSLWYFTFAGDPLVSVP